MDALTVSTIPANPAIAASEILSSYSLLAAVNGAYASDHGASRVDITALSVRDNKQALTLAKAGEGSISLVTPVTGLPEATGGVSFAVDLAFWNNLLQKLASSTEQASSTTAPSQLVENAAEAHPMKLTKGHLEGVVQLASALAGSHALSLDMDATQLTAAGEGPGIVNEGLHLAGKAAASDDFSRLTVSSLDTTGSVLTAHVSKAVVWLKTGPEKMLGPLRPCRWFGSSGINTGSGRGESSSAARCPDAGETSRPCHAGVAIASGSMDGVATQLLQSARRHRGIVREAVDFGPAGK